MEWSPTKGLLVLIGGNEDKIKTQTILRYVADAANARCICIIPTASVYGKELGDEYAAIFKKLGMSKAHVLDARYVGDADKPQYQSMVQEADCFFFTGGDQVKLVNVFQSTDVLRTIYEKHNAGALVAGTSAGAAAASDKMLYDGDDYGFNKAAVRVQEGFGFLPTITVDTHFLQRNRIPRLAQMLARGVNRFAVGVDEDTALIIDAVGDATVLGSDMVTFMAASETLSFSGNYDHVPADAHFSIHGISTSFLASGAKFQLDTWQLISA